jgi:hypothetical protein
MSVDYTTGIPDELDVQDILHNLKEWEYKMYYEFIPEHIKEEIAVRLFTDTPASGNKGIQEDIIQDLCDKLRIDQLYNMGLVNDKWLRTLYQAYIEYEDAE